MQGEPPGRLLRRQPRLARIEHFDAKLQDHERYRPNRERHGVGIINPHGEFVVSHVRVAESLALAPPGIDGFPGRAHGRTIAELLAGGA